MSYWTIKHFLYFTTINVIMNTLGTKSLRTSMLTSRWKKCSRRKRKKARLIASK